MPNRDNSPHAVSDAERTYAKKLAEVYVKLARMSPEQRAKYADKAKELSARLAKLPPAVKEIYDNEVRALSGAAASPAVSEKESAETAGKAAEPHQEEEVPVRRTSRKPKYEPDEDEYDDDDDYDDTDERPRRKGKAKGCLIVFLVLLLLVAAAGAFGWMWVNSEINGERGTEVSEATVIVERGSGPLTIGKLLQQNGIIRNAQVFRLYVRQTDTAGTLQYGEFTFSSDMSYDQIIETLQETNKERDDIVEVTFPEGIPAVEFANRMEEAGLCTAEEFLEEANNGDFSEFTFWNRRDENPNQFMACEGYLFPDTYQFFKDDSVHNMVAKLYAQFDANMTEEIYAQIDEMGFTLTEFITLASIVQEEAGDVEHQADVAAVFMNRLAEGSPVPKLQSNCSSYIQNDDDNNYIYNTIAWYYGDWNSIPAEIISAYDTYSIEGLPAGPISNPGLDAILNTLKYKESEYYGDYYYFVTDLTGKYYFAKTYEEHLQNDETRLEVNASLGQ